MARPVSVETMTPLARAGMLPRTAAAIKGGQRQLRHLALHEHDPADALVHRHAVSPELFERVVDRFAGRIAVQDVTVGDEIVVTAGEEISDQAARRIYQERARVPRVRVRSIMTCKAREGVCRACYGRNLATGRLVEIGEAVGVIAAQSIGEPGTQLTMRTFHTGGVATGGSDITQGLPRVEELFEARVPKGKALISEIDGDVEVLELDELPRERADRFAARTGFDPRTLATRYRWFRVSPRRIQAWREVDEVAGRELMREGRWLD